MRAWNGRAFAAALIVGATCLASVVHYPEKPTIADLFHRRTPSPSRSAN